MRNVKKTGVSKFQVEESKLRTIYDKTRTLSNLSIQIRLLENLNVSFHSRNFFDPIYCPGCSLKF